MYCSVLWKPHLIKHIQLIERIQRRATKYVLNDYVSDYKSRLIKLQILPLMYILDLNDVIFFVRSLKTLMKDLTLKISFLLLQGILDQLIATSFDILDPPTTAQTTSTLTDFHEFGMHSL